MNLDLEQEQRIAHIRELIIKSYGEGISYANTYRLAGAIDQFYTGEGGTWDLALPDPTNIQQLAEFAIEQPEVMAYMDADKKINAIKELRGLGHCGLKEAKHAIELAQSMIARGYVSSRERQRIEEESADAIESIRATMSALHEGARSAGVDLPRCSD